MLLGACLKFDPNFVLRVSPIARFLSLFPTNGPLGRATLFENFLRATLLHFQNFRRRFQSLERRKAGMEWTRAEAQPLPHGVVQDLPDDVIQAARDVIRLQVERERAVVQQAAPLEGPVERAEEAHRNAPHRDGLPKPGRVLRSMIQRMKKREQEFDQLRRSKAVSLGRGRVRLGFLDGYKCGAGECRARLKLESEITFLKFTI